jgi:hypothetical protein
LTDQQSTVQKLIPAKKVSQKRVPRKSIKDLDRVVVKVEERKGRSEDKTHRFSQQIGEVSIF